ncbi:MAG: hypothetical protein CVV04_04235 [Firmicutes bacterium HGW-Firmicutes-9]|nr:MAG: hypothetical protein CVV04_04235 [Firmicutes bacterium HGW-Firmicutes-9]
MQRMNDTFNQTHLKKIRSRVGEELGLSFQKCKTQGTLMRFSVALAVFAACFLTITPALAIGIPAVNDLLYFVLPETAQFFKTVQMSDIDQNIEINVESAYVHGSKAEILVSVRDLNRDRLDDSIDFYDSYDLRTGFDSIGTCNQIGYDTSTGTATFLIEISSMNSDDLITGKKITLSFQTILSGKETKMAVPIQMDWSNISNEVITEKAEHSDAMLLIPGEEILKIMDGFLVTGVGYVGEQLHIQLYTPRRHQFDDHAALYLKNEAEAIIQANAVYRGGYNTGDPELDKRADYIDFVFDVPNDLLSHYKLYGDFYSATTRIDGDWSITFPLENN